MYIDAKQIGKRIFVSERDASGSRHIRTHSAPYTFYYTDPRGDHRSIDGKRVARFRTFDRKEFERELGNQRSRGVEIYESDVPVLFRLLEEKYPGDESPTLNIAFLDIEVDKDPKKGFAHVSNPYAAINAITIYNKWHDEAFTLVVAPENIDPDEARALLDGDLFQDKQGNLVDECPEDDDFGSMTEDDGYFIVRDEAQLLELTLDLIEDADVISGWNSEFFDIPYTIQRMRHVLGGESLEKLAREDCSDLHPYSPSDESRAIIDRLNLFPCPPRLRLTEKFGSMEKTYQLYGRVHLDYLDLYRKFTYEELHSYTLDFILRHEVKQKKIAYEGSLDQLYRWDFRRFTAYNRQDVMGLSAIDDKRKMIQLANSMAHMAGVTLDKVLGSVTIIEQAILKQLHKQNLICFDKRDKDKDLPVPGAYVVEPDKGIYDWVCSYDFNSLYPTVIRIVNISPETVVGQFDPSRTVAKWNEYFAIYDDAAKAWGKFTGALEYHDIMDETDTPLTLIYEDGNTETMTGKEWKAALKDRNLSISANGTVFDLSRDGIVTQCMSMWYAERADFKKKAGSLFKEAETINDPDRKAEVLEEARYYDMVQLVKKIFLNSTYGAYLNQFFRFYDPRLGASVTLSGRVMTKHMIRDVARIMTGNYDEKEKRAVIYGDTDSVYATLDWYMDHLGMEKTVENAVEMADQVGGVLNEGMPKFLSGAFLIPEDRGRIVEAGREVVATRGIFKDAKKRYALHVVDEEGKKKSKMKIMGMETRRSDTPSFIQNFLEECLTMVVRDRASYEKIRDKVNEFRKTFAELPPWKRGSPGRVKNLKNGTIKFQHWFKQASDGYRDEKKPQIHVTVKAAMNTNLLIEANQEHRWDTIRDGDKVEVLYLLDNMDNMDAVAIPVGENYVPEWFQELPFDNHRMEEKLIDRKMSNILGDILGWDFSRPKNFSNEVLETEDDFYD